MTGGATPEQMVPDGSTEKQTEQPWKVIQEAALSPWPLSRFLPPGSCPELDWKG